MHAALKASLILDEIQFFYVLRLNLVLSHDDAEKIFALSLFFAYFLSRWRFSIRLNTQISISLVKRKN